MCGRAGFMNKGGEPSTRFPPGGKHQLHSPGLPGLGAARGWVRVHLVCEPERLRCFHLDAVHPSPQSDQRSKAPGVSAKATKGREGTGELGWEGGGPIRPSISTPLSQSSLN